MAVVTIPPVSEQYLANQPIAARLAVIIDVLLGLTGGAINPIPPVLPPPTIAGGGNWNSGAMPANGNAFAASVLSTQNGSLVIQRFIDAAGTIPIGNAITQAIAANTLATVAVNDGLPAASFTVQVNNTSGGVANISEVIILEKK